MEAVQRFNLYNGGGALPPRWGLGFWHRTPTLYSDKQVMSEGEEFKKQIRPILDQVYVHAEHIIGIENVETMLSELKAVHNVLENI